MIKQKQMLAEHFMELSQVRETGRKVVYTFVPGNLAEFVSTFDMLPVYPEINALQSGMRKKSEEYIREAEDIGYSEDVCSYVKCDIGMMLQGNIGPTGQRLPAPDILLLSYTGCFVFMKWFENLRHLYPNTEIAMLHVPYQEAGRIEPAAVKYVKDQLIKSVIPKFEKVSGQKFDIDKLGRKLELAAQAENLLVDIFDSARHRPSPIDAYFGGVYYIGPIFTAFRGNEDCIDYYRELKAEVDYRVAKKLGPITPEGHLENERFRLVVEGPPNWTHFRDFWKMFYDRGAVFVGSSYTRVGGVYDDGFRHSSKDPLASLAEYCMGCYTNRSLPQRISLLERFIKNNHADGLLVNSIKSCNSFSAGQLVMMRDLEARLGIPVGFIETDLVDPRYYSFSNIKNRLDSFFQMLEQRQSIWIGDDSLSDDVLA
ncbi:MAG: benzoyl-CoA reductase subunit B [candidate division Zixibacteria bacterium RBG_16_53_22]|nr:MAG: benzoyl-CoA reductase subunit B [candidate division Zixibacteria bacterium RBG_16_53_22]